MYKILFFAFLLANSALGHSENQPISVYGELITVDIPGEKNRFRENVKVNSGSTHLSGDKLEQFLKDGDTDRAIVTGQPAKFKGILEGESVSSSGEAEEIIYLVLENKILMKEFTLVDPQGNKQSGKNGTFILE